MQLTCINVIILRSICEQIVKWHGKWYLPPSSVVSRQLVKVVEFCRTVDFFVKDSGQIFQRMWLYVCFPVSQCLSPLHYANRATVANISLEMESANANARLPEQNRSSTELLWQCLTAKPERSWVDCETSPDFQHWGRRRWLNCHCKVFRFNVTLLSNRLHNLKDIESWNHQRLHWLPKNLAITMQFFPPLGMWSPGKSKVNRWTVSSID